MEISGITVVVLETAQAVGIRAQVELAAVLRQRPDALVSFAGGATSYATFFAAIERDSQSGRLDLSQMHCTQLAEFQGFDAGRAGGIAQELLQCSPLQRAADEGRFHPIPASGDAADLQAYEAHLRTLGGVQLQFVGIGEHGRFGSCEPGVDPNLGFHSTVLSQATRDQLVARFVPEPVPPAAVTAGPRSLLEAHRLVLMATGKNKQNAVREMMESAVSSACPASFVRRHRDALILLDSEAACGLDWPELSTTSAT